jgi:hypothetical protein
MFRNAFATRASSPARTVYRANTATAIVSLSSGPGDCVRTGLAGGMISTYI